MADHVRGYIHAAYAWGMKSEHDYRSSAPRRFRLVYNPAAGIPTEPKNVGTRWLDDEEFVRLYRWLEDPDAPVHPPYTRAVRILMLTGQRVEEIARLHVDQWDVEERIIDWSKSKNGQPHAIPVPLLAAELIESIKPNRHGWFFPSARDAARPVSHNTLYSFMWRQRDRGVIPMVSNRDLRRTWKTLAGKAGVPKEIRDRIQNHALQDVSSKSYRSLELYARKACRDGKVGRVRAGPSRQRSPRPRGVIRTRDCLSRSNPSQEAACLTRAASTVRCGTAREDCSI